MGGRSKKVDKRRQLALPSLPDWWKGGLLHEKRWKNSGRVRKVKKAVSLPPSLPNTKQTGRAEQLLWVTLA